MIARTAALQQLERGVERRVNGHILVRVRVDVAQVVELLAVHVRAENLQRVAGGLGIERAPLVRGVGSAVAEVVVEGEVLTGVHFAAQDGYLLNPGFGADQRVHPYGQGERGHGYQSYDQHHAELQPALRQRYVYGLVYGGSVVGD